MLPTAAPIATEAAELPPALRDGSSPLLIMVPGAWLGGVPVDGGDDAVKVVLPVSSLMRDTVLAACELLMDSSDA